MTDSEKLDAIAADVAFLVEVVRGMGFGQRILPGDGSKPVDPPPAPPVDTPPPGYKPTGNPLLDSYANSNPIVDNGPAAFDRRTLRDLSDTQGPAIVEGGAGTVAEIVCRRPAGSTVEITCGRTPSQFGTCTSVDLWVGNLHAEGRGSDASGSLTFISSGNDVIRVVLNEAGGIEVHRSY